MTTCKAHPNHNFYGEPIGIVNYGKPHVPVAGKDGERQRMSCLFCGQWLEA